MKPDHPIPHKDLKRKLLGASINHPDTVLRAFARIDFDENFRAALAAAIATEEDGAIANVVYAQYPPDKRRGRLRIPKRVSADDLMRLLNERVVEQAAALLTDKALRSAVRRFVEKNVQDLIIETLGLNSSYDYRTNSPVRSRMKEVIQQELDACADEIVESFRHEPVVWAEVLDKAASEFKQEYIRAYENGLEKRIREEARERAKLDIEKAFETLTFVPDDEEDVA